MTNLLIILFSLLSGVAIGAFFFGGLWWTVKKGTPARYPALWFIGSIIIRFGVTLIWFYWVAGNHWERMLLCLAGFIVARIVVTKMTRQPQTQQIQ